MRILCVLASFALISVAARADVADYCAAYARDIADQVDASSPLWQRRHDNAESFCNERYAPQKIAVKPEPAPKAVAEKPKVITKPKVKPAIVETLKEEPVVAAQTARVVPQLVAGSTEWIEYCKKKYVSFNEASGTYTSRTGVERRCLVTAD